MEIDLQALAETTDPADRAKRASSLIDDHQARIGELSRIRREALDEMVSQGLTQTQIADLIGMTRSRVGQLLSSGPRPERAFLGSGTLTVAVGGKHEAGKAKPGPVVSAEAFAAYQKLADVAQSYGLKSEYEVVPPPGMVQLNRTNLIVVCSPRLLPFVGQVLESDTNLGFREDEQGWYLVDHRTNETYRSPMDAGENCDYAYIGRLPRPDARGSFLYLAGIHSVGTEGAAHFLESHLEELYREVKTRRFSLLISCQYNPKDRAITSTNQITPVYRPEGVA